MTDRRPVFETPTTSRFLAAAFAGLLTVAAAPPSALAQPSEADLVVHLCADGPGSPVAEALRRAGEAEVEAADVLPNPSVVLQHQQTLDGPQDRETIVALSVPLGLGGRRFVRQHAAEARRAAGAASADAHLVDLAIDVQELIAAVSLDQRRVAVLIEQQRELETLDVVLAGLGRGGEIARHDQRRQRVQVRLHRARVEEAQARAVASAALARGWTRVAPPALPASSLLAVGSTRPPPASRPPRFIAREAEASALELDAEAAERGWVPEVDVYAGYRNVDAGAGIGHGLSLGLTIPLTAFDRGQGEAARANAAAGLTRAQLAGDRVRLHRLERAAAARLDLLIETAADVEAAARESGEVASASRELYAAGETTLTELFAAYEAHEEARLAWIDRLDAIATARVALMRARGALLDPALERACLAAARGEKR